MIYYFSGTGNTRLVAKQLSRLLLEEYKMITEVNPAEAVMEGESIGFVFPVYSWGVPPLMTSFIESIRESFWEEIKCSQVPVWCVMTCGDEVALAPEMIQKTLGKHDVELESIWSVIMPNNYVILPGFDVDSKNVEERKLAAYPGRIKEIAKGINQHMRTVDVVRGSIPWLKTKLVYPLFCKWGISPKKWHITPACVGCGICAKACPLHNVTMVERTPHWGSNCCSCLACYHSCPRHAVAYGNATASKGQYFVKN